MSRIGTMRWGILVLGVFTLGRAGHLLPDRPFEGGIDDTWSCVNPHWSPAEQAVMRAALQEKHAKLTRKSLERFDKPQEAQEFFLRQRRPLDGADIPLEHLHAESRKLQAREQELARKRGGRFGAGGIGAWNSIGPGNIGGRTRAIAIDPTNPDTMYAAGVTGGIWKSIDAGASWLVADDLLPNLAVSTIAIDPTNPAVIYAGTGEGFFANYFQHRGLGIFKSTDSGATWNLLPGTVDGVPTGSFYFVNKIVISPNDPNRLYAATMFGVWRSLDAGASWSVVLRNPWALTDPPAVPESNGCSVGCTDLAVRSDLNPDVLLAAFGSFQKDGLFRSVDGGDTWVGYATPPEQGRMTLAIAPSDNQRMYILMAQNSDAWQGKLYSVFRSDDGGASWISSLDFGHPFSEWLLSYVAIATGCYEHPVIYSQGWYDNIIAVDPVDPDIVWVGGIDLFRSDNAGTTFGLASYWFYYMDDPVPPTYIHPDNHTIVFHPDYDGAANQTMFVGNDGGIFKTYNARAATTQEECPIGPDPGPQHDVAWESCNNGYGVTQFYHGDSAVETHMYVGGAQDNGTSRGLAADQPNAWRMIQGGDGGYVAIDPTDSQRLFVEIQGFPELRVSYDGGETFALAVDGITDTDGLFITPFVMDQSDPNVLWTGGGRPWRTTNGAASWEPAGPNFAGAGTISAIVVAPTDSNVVYVGYADGFAARTTNGLDPSPTWTLYTDGLYQGGWISSVAVDPDDPDVAYCTYSNYGIPHVFRKPKGSVRWSPIDGGGTTGLPDIPTHWVAVRPCNANQLYAATELGVMATNNGGSTWEPVNDGLAHTIVETLDFKNDDTLIAFTHGRSAFSATLEPCGVAPIPAVSDWGLIVMALLLAVAGTACFRGRLPAVTSGV